MTLAFATGSFVVAAATPTYTRRLHPRLDHRTRSQAALPSDCARRTTQVRCHVSSGAAATSTASKPSKEARLASFGRQRPEEQAELELPVSGVVPSWLAGNYVRNGPGDLEGMRHLFDGYAMLHKTRIKDGRVFCMHKFLKSEAYRHKLDTGKMRWREFATPVQHSDPFSVLRMVGETALGVFGSLAGVTDNASVNVVPSPTPGRALALTETVTGTYEIDLDTLDTVRQVAYPDSVAGSLTTAHPRLTADGSIINITSEVMKGYHVYRQQRGSLKRDEIAYIPHLNGATPAWIHDFAVSKNYVIITESPFFFNLSSIMTGAPTDYVFMDWKGDQPTRIHLIHLGTGEVTTKSAPPLWAFHFLNAFESDDGREVYLDIAKFETPKVLNQLSIANLMNVDAEDLDCSHPERMTIRMWPGTGNIAPQDIRKLIKHDNYGSYCEFPTINALYRCIPYRYAYCIGAVRPSNIANALVKHDVEEGTSRVWHEAGCAPGEPTFVARPGAVAEDDGVVISVCVGSNGRGFVLFLDGSSFEEVARADLPYGLAYGFHGNFFHATPDK